MQLYLINKNPIISKLVALSATKLGVEVVESQEIKQDMSAEIVLLDDECYEAEAFAAYKESHKDAKIGLFYAKATARIEGFSAYIQKPFLPTDLVKTLSEITGIAVIDNIGQAPQGKSEPLEVGEEALNLDEEVDFENLDDLELDDEIAPEKDNTENPDAQLDFGADEGIEESHGDSAEPLESIESLDSIEGAPAGEDPNAQLDFGADEIEPIGEKGFDGIEEVKPPEQKEASSTETQVLDVGDVDTIKDLLKSDEVGEGTEAQEAVNVESVPKDTEVAGNTDSEALLGVDDLDLDKELSGLGGHEETDLTGLQEELDSIQTAEESKDESLAQEEATQENSKIPEALDGLEDSVDGHLDDHLDTDLESLNLEKHLEGLTEAEETDSKGAEVSVDGSGTSAEDDIGSQELDFSDFSLDDLDTGDEEHTQDGGAKDSTEGFESVDGGIESVGSQDTDKAEEPILEDADFDLSSLESKDNAHEPSDLPQDFGDFSFEATETGDAQGMSGDSKESESLGDEFESLSIEGIGEALGEPVPKAPIPTPIVAEEPLMDSKTQSIQANSLETLISALQSLQTQSLKELLSGATINISIQFPQKDDQK